MIRSEATFCLHTLRGADKILASALGSEFEISLTKELSAASVGQMQTASKLMSVYDLCFDQDCAALDLGSLPVGERYVDGLSDVSIFDGSWQERRNW